MTSVKSNFEEFNKLVYVKDENEKKFKTSSKHYYFNFFSGLMMNNWDFLYSEYKGKFMYRIFD